MRRRQFLQAVGGAASAWPLTVGAEPTLRPTIGVLFPGASTFRLSPIFLAGLSELGLSREKRSRSSIGLRKDDTSGCQRSPQTLWHARSTYRRLRGSGRARCQGGDLDHSRGLCHRR